MDGVELFAALGHAARLRCMVLLVRHGELCVCELTHALDASQPYVSRHLAHLREQELVVSRRAGQWIYYRVNPELPAWMHALLRTAADGIAHQEPLRADTRRLDAMPNRPGSGCCG
jgi:ArsR family transcriptional regulator